MYHQRPAKMTQLMPVVMAALSKSLGATGAPGSVPGAISASSCCERTPKGSTANRTIHQIVKKMARPIVVENVGFGDEFSQQGAVFAEVGVFDPVEHTDDEIGGQDGHCDAG